ncbi:MAG: hypothetical protein JW894_07545 [Bacteroidales bacterium]|nr:hypothetical protein [Bacteroidales bacterium]
MKALQFFIILIYCNCYANAKHPIHLSVINLQVNKDSNYLEYSVRLYYDDFQQYINYKYNTILDFKSRNRLTTKEQQAVTDYLNSSFVIKNAYNKSRLKPVFKQWKIEDDSVWLFFYAKTDPDLEEIIVENTILIELFNDQKNLLIVNILSLQKGIEFNKRKTTDRIKL